MLLVLLDISAIKKCWLVGGMRFSGGWHHACFLGGRASRSMDKGAPISKGKWSCKRACHYKAWTTDCMSVRILAVELRDMPEPDTIWRSKGYAGIDTNSRHLPIISTSPKQCQVRTGIQQLNIVGTWNLWCNRKVNGRHSAAMLNSAQCWTTTQLVCLELSQGRSGRQK